MTKDGTSTSRYCKFAGFAPLDRSDSASHALGGLQLLANIWVELATKWHWKIRVG